MGDYYFHAGNMKDLWNFLGKHPINTKALDRFTGHPAEAYNPEVNECWQYMGSIQQFTDRFMQHQFRHRCHPGYGKRVDITILESRYDGELTYAKDLRHDEMIEEQKRIHEEKVRRFKMFSALFTDPKAAKGGAK